MIIPSIDLMNGHTVQLVGGKELKLDVGDPRPIAEDFKLAGEIAVVDLDAALGQGSNADVIRDLLRIAPCRVGGGIRTVERAIEWLDAGATKVVLGTAANPEVLRELPRERVIAALDAFDGEVVVDGWRTKTGRGVIEHMRELEGLIGGFLVTFVEKEGRLRGCKMAAVEPLAKAAGDARLTIAGGITTAEEVAELDRLGADAQVGMGLYASVLDFGKAIVAPMVSDRADGLWPTVVVDEQGVALGLCYSNHQSVVEAVRTRRGVYWSRKRGLWRKGETSGATQELLRVDLDCDRDALRFVVRQRGSGFCHQDTWTCWGQAGGLPALDRNVAGRLRNAPAGSYTRRLFDDPQWLGAKLLEEARELTEAEGQSAVAWEAADVFYFAFVAMARAGVRMVDVEQELDRRALRISRRPGLPKPTKEVPQ